MFTGEDELIMVRYEGETRKKLSARCLIHEALIAELRELFGEENVVVK